MYHYKSHGDLMPKIFMSWTLTSMIASSKLRVGLRSFLGGLLALGAIALTIPPCQAATLFDDLGGEKGLTQISSDMVDNALADPRIKGSFDNVNIQRLKQHLYVKFCSLANGPCVYKGRDMQHVHAGLHLHEGDFNALAEDLETAMEKSDIPYSVQSQFLERLAALEGQVVSR